MVSINPRFGCWDDRAVAFVDLGKKQLPSVLSFDGRLPGDVNGRRPGSELGPARSCWPRCR